MRKDKLMLAAAIGTVLMAATAQAENATDVDTSSWACESCPFQTEYEARATVGANYVDEDSAKYGEYNGLDQKGAYADVSARGGSRSESGTYYRYELKDLGLDTREAKLVAGKEGLAEGTLYYDELPHRVWDTTETPYARSGQDALVLPADWARAGSTAGMSALAGSLAPRDIGTDRKTIGARLAYLFGSNLKFYADYGSQDIEGSKLSSANFLFLSLQYPEPIKATHDQVEVGATYKWKSGFARLSWYGSTYDNSVSSLTFDNPYLPAAPDTVQGRKAGAPDNKAQTFALDGNFLLPFWNSVLSYRLAQGTMDQSEDFLPFSTSAVLDATAVLPRQALNADVSTSHYRATLSVKPHSRLRAHVGYRYDERDNSTADFSTTGFVESDSVIGAAAIARPYSYKRTRVDGYGEARLFDWLSLGAGADSDKLERSNQETSQTKEERSYVELRMRPWGSIEVSGRYGNANVKAGDYTVISGPVPENPLLRKFNQADRSSDFSELRFAWSPWKLTIAAEGRYSFDSYSKSPLGLVSGRDYRYAGTVSMPVGEKASVYVSGSYQNIATEQAGQEVFPGYSRVWRVSHEDEFGTAGGGVVWKKVADKVDVRLDYVYAKSQGPIDTLVGNAPESEVFPRLTTELNSLRLSASYPINERLRVSAAWTWEDYRSRDWQIAGLEPATLGNLLGMGADPYDYSVNVIGVSFTYRFGPSVFDE
jgi:MtrB/PioB family decaheme-associated outer membrane protein